MWDRCFNKLDVKNNLCLPGMNSEAFMVAGLPPPKRASACLEGVGKTITGSLGSHIIGKPSQ